MLKSFSIMVYFNGGKNELAPVININAKYYIIADGGAGSSGEPALRTGTKTKTIATTMKTKRLSKKVGSLKTISDFKKS